MFNNEGIKMKISKLVAITVVAMFVFSACSDSEAAKHPNLQDEIFCKYVEEENFEALIPIMNDFFKEIEPALDDKAKLQKLCDWLNEKDCVINAEIQCVNCIKTLPPMSHLLVSFATQNGAKELELCVGGSESLGVSGWHYPDEE